MDDEYFQRWMETRSKLLTDVRFSHVSSRVFRALYTGGGGVGDSFITSNLVNHGMHHYIVRIPIDSDICVALRLQVYSSCRPIIYEPSVLNDLFAQEVGSFELAFDEGKNPSSFTGVITAQGKFGRIAGIVTEDLSRDGRDSVVNVGIGSPFGVRGSDGVRFYVDPEQDYKEHEAIERGRKYLAEGARIDL